jgi:tryptophan halogenase
MKTQLGGLELLKTFDQKNIGYLIKGACKDMIKKIVIVGGGFASWYTAASIKHNFPNIQLVVIDGDRFSRLGVGETLGWSAPYDWKKNLGLKDDRMLMWRTGAIYKYGLSVDDFWQDQQRFSYGKFFNLKVRSLSKFYGEFDYPDFYEPWNRVEGDIGVQQAWMSINKYSEKRFNEYINELNESSFFTSNPCAPYDLNNRYVLRPGEGWSYHIDSEQTVEFFKELAIDNNPNISHISSAVVDANLKDNGDIQSLLLENGNVVSGDLFVDCSGFARVLLKHYHNDSWVPAGEEFCNSAWVCPTRYIDPENEMVGGTEIIGEDFGWRFCVRLYHRAGNGYVFNDKLVDESTPLEKLIGVTEGRRLADPRKITWTPGHYNTPWQGNVMLLGISANFIDPYDAPTFDIHSRALEDFFECLKENTVQSAKNKFNSASKLVAEERQLRLIFNFGLSKRQGPFWDSRRQILIDGKYIDQLYEIINENRSDIESRLKHFWHQMYYRMLIATDTSRTKIHTKELSADDKMMAEQFFLYNRTRNQYIKKQNWPNYYLWLKENRFNGHSSQEMLSKFHPSWVK